MFSVFLSRVLLSRGISVFIMTRQDRVNRQGKTNICHMVQEVRAVIWQSEGCRFNPTLGMSKCPWARHLTPNCSSRAGWYLAWQPIPVNVWIRDINCTALWIKALNKCPFTIQTERQWKHLSPHFSLFLGKTDIEIYVPKMKKWKRRHLCLKGVSSFNLMWCLTFQTAQVHIVMSENISITMCHLSSTPDLTPIVCL